MKKKLITMVILLLVVVIGAMSLVACGDKSPTKKNTKFVIGSSGPLTGPNAIYGLAVKNAAQMAIDEINANGGLNGIDFELNMKDDMGEPEKATSAYSVLYDEGMNISIGTVTTGAGKAFAASAAKDDLFFITPSASGDDVVVGDYAYRVCFGDPDQGVKAANWFKTEEFANAHPNLKIGIIYKNDDAYSDGIYKAFMENKGDLNVVSSSYNKDSNTNFETAVTKMKTEKCNVLLLPIYYQEATLIVTETKKQNYNPTIFGCDGLDGIESYAEDADLDVSGVSYFTPFDVNSDDENVKTFVKNYKEKYDDVPNQFAADGYDAIYILFEIMKKADLKDPKLSIKEITELVNPFMADLTFDGLTGKGMKWNSKGHCEKPIQVVVIK